MTQSVNRCLFIGRLGADPETRTTQSGAQVCNFRMAVSESWMDKASGQKKESTTWVPVVVWGGLAEIASKYLRKGSLVYVAGKFSVRKWTDQSGADRYSTEVVLQGFNAELVVLGGKDDGGTKPRRTYADKDTADFDDAPFDFDFKAPF